MRKRITPLMIIILLAGAITGVTGLSCGDTTEPVEADTITIGAAISLTGKYADSGKWYEQAYQMWQDQVNEKGGLLGKEVQLILYDDQSDATTGSSLYQKLITVDEVDCILGAYSSTVIMSTSNIAEKYEMLYLEGGGTSSRIFDRGFEYVFLTWPGLAEDYSKGLFELIQTLPEKEKPSSVGFLYKDAFFPLSVAEGGKTWAEDAGLSVEFYESYTEPTTIDFSTILRKFKDADVDIVIGAGYYPDSELLVRTCKQLKYNPTAIWSSVGPGMVDFGNNLGEDANHVFCGVHFDVASPYEGVSEFTEDFESRYDKTPGYHAAGAYATCQVLETAIEETQSLDNKVLRDYVASHTVGTILGDLSWDDRGVPEEAMLTVQWQDGQAKIVWPSEAKAAEPVFPKPEAW